MKKPHFILLIITLAFIQISTSHTEVVLMVKSLDILCDDLTVTSLWMDNPDDTVAALQVDIFFETDCIIVTGVEKTERSESMDIFNYSDIDGGLRIAITGIGNVINPGIGPIAYIHFTYDYPEEYFWELSGCVIADQYGSEIHYSTINNAVFECPDACFLEFSEEEIELGNVLIGDTVTMTLSIWNIGNAYDDVSITVSGCATCDVENISLYLGVSQDITVGCCPTEKGPSEGTITFSGCRCGDQTITVSCYGIECEGRGDVNEDGYINVLDVIIVINYIWDISLIPPTFPLCRADCDDNNEINVLDALAIVNVILEIGTCGP